MNFHFDLPDTLTVRLPTDSTEKVQSLKRFTQRFWPNDNTVVCAMVVPQLAGVGNPAISDMGEDKANMLGWLGYGAADRVSGKCDDARAAERVEAVALNSESSYGPRQVPEVPGAMPLAGRSAAIATRDAGTSDAVEGLVEVAEITASQSDGEGRAFFAGLRAAVAIAPCTAILRRRKRTSTTRENWETGGRREAQFAFGNGLRPVIFTRGIIV